MTCAASNSPCITEQKATIQDRCNKHSSPLSMGMNKSRRLGQSQRVKINGGDAPSKEDRGCKEGCKAAHVALYIEYKGHPSEGSVNRGVAWPGLEGSCIDPKLLA